MHTFGKEPLTQPSDATVRSSVGSGCDVAARKIWDRAGHNGFTSLVRHQGWFYCAFREATDHHSADGVIRILRCRDGRTWASVAVLAVEKWDLRDPKFSVRHDGMLMLHVGGRLCSALASLRTMAYESSDGLSWHALGDVGEDGYWLWGVSWHDGIGYAVGYGRDGEGGLTTRLYRSSDGVQFTAVVPTLFSDGRPSEATILFLPDADAVCLLRRDGEQPSAQLGLAKPPYRSWTWHDLGMRIGGQRMQRLPDGRIVVATRLHDDGERTALCWLDLDAAVLDEFVTLPSGGDTSYPGMTVHDGALWVSYYSSHEGHANIYVARVLMSAI